MPEPLEGSFKADFLTMIEAAQIMKRKVQLTVEIEVEVDEEKFTPEFYKEFNSSIFFTDCIEDHIKQLAYVAAREEPGSDSFVEGYGKLSDMGIKLSEPQFVQSEIIYF